MKKEPHTSVEMSMNRTMRICYIGSVKSMHMQRWVDYFAQRGHEVHVISFGYHLDAIKNENVKIYYLKKLQSRVKIS